MVKRADKLKQLECVSVQCDGNRETAQRFKTAGAESKFHIIWLGIPTG